MTHQGEFITSDGIRLGYQLGGNPKGPPILFCYGLVCSSFHFKYQWKHLESDYRLLMLDYRGHHVSEDPEAITTLNFVRIIEDLKEFLVHEKVKKQVTVVGYSMGVNIAVELHARYSQLVSSLVLISGAAKFPASNPSELKRLSVAHSVFQIVDGLFPKLADEFWRCQRSLPGVESFAGFVGFNPKLTKSEDIKGVIKVMTEVSPKVFAQLFGEYIRHDRNNHLSEIKVPTLIIGGEFDRLVPMRFQRQMHEGIAGSEMVCIKDASHMPQFDRPDEVNSALAHFLERLFL